MKLHKVLGLGAALLLIAAVSLSARGQGAGSSGAAGGQTLNYWLALNANVGAHYTDLNDTPYAKELEKQTGIVVEYLHPPVGAEAEQFNLLIASGELPDIIEYNWLTYPGGPEKAVTDKVILKLNDLFAKSAPNLSAYLKSRPDADRMIKTDSGSYYVFPFIRGDPYLLNSQGPQLRQDWLDDLGLKVPVTMDDWHTVLSAFKQRKGASAPFTATISNVHAAFVYAYSLDRGFYVGDDKKVHYGAIEPAFRNYLTTMAQWFREGLLDPDLATISGQQISAKYTGGASGATFGWVASGMGVWTGAGQATDKNYKLVGAPYPVLRAGDPQFLCPTDWPYANLGGAITTACKNVETAAKLLDYGYGPEGHLLMNFGIPGESYNMVNGYPTFSDAMYRHPENWPLGQAIGAYARSVYGGAFVQDKRYMEQYIPLPEQKAAVGTWMPADAVFTHKLPPITPSQEESGEYARIMNEINTYSDEMILKFIMGTENLSGFDNFVSTIQRLGINRAIEIQNGALARYNSR
jgi:putative aldouronate transport system substrate-binding protein